jgi:hypothetical protein
MRPRDHPPAPAGTRPVSDAALSPENARAVAPRSGKIGTAAVFQSSGLVARAGPRLPPHQPLGRTGRAVLPVHTRLAGEIQRRSK